MNNLSKNDENTITQSRVTEFYDRMVFPSKTSHKAYEDLVPRTLEGLKVGDFGCGQSLFINIFRDLKYDAIFLDISQNALKTINYGMKIRASLTDIPLEDDLMDVIFCIGVVHHIPEMEKAISELVRVLKKGGRLYLGVYADKSLQATLRKIYDSTNNLFFKKIVYITTGLLIWLKNRKNGLYFRSIEHYKRTDDLLITPLVKYLPETQYIKLFLKYNSKIIEIKRISSMNILIIEKAI